ncbi:precorrin-6y C5,15-methyltransferase (decarboxylating) subunit CbiE [Dissulfurimicrobium hydrothermale]|uniref:precorrin-6y C5,15-methyltransferase (decarboxylating) subunit CbiE n=1 Tax=Dissulfurimicrobium hydrothermale TaxID=1750598 RepID=UPI001EDC7B23|nr:precorrin-6y C5,15-methyltransferase (decarboxylating) subunit CbiE [Dissulfurimicrobium hydrothermale]UKL13064.1 precorrin-6y C5,15-methyltransferase (decarboxylating) subunit CbiE [Dissulfurimicrobium hydrothermale]
MHRLHLIGIGPEGPSKMGRNAILSCGYAVTPERFRSFIHSADLGIIPIVPIKEAIKAIRDALNKTDVAVLADGDPLFYGIGRLIIKEFERDVITIYPALSSMQLAFSCLKEPWDDAHFLSLHGREIDDIHGRILLHQKTFILTDDVHDPSFIAKRLLDALPPDRRGDYLVFVGERLGMKDERVFEGRLDEAVGQEFAEPNVMIVIRKTRAEDEDHPFVFGLTESQIEHSRGLITKDEVRAVTIHRLRPPKEGVLWDIGAGSGSVSIETGRISPRLKIFAIEKDGAEMFNLRTNIMRFGVWNITPVHGEAPGVLSGLPDPDRVFIGGSGGSLPGIIASTARRLKNSGRIVINAVTAKTRDLAPRLMCEAGLEVDISEISVTRRKLEDGTSLNLNPISIITGVK